MKNSENDNNSKDIEVPLNIFESHLIEAINKVEGFSYGDIKYLNKYPNEISEKVLILLLEYACLAQNYVPIELGRKKIEEINKKWLCDNLIRVSRKCIDFSNEWEYRRLVELVVEAVPKLKGELLKLGENSENLEIREVVEDFL